MTAVRHTTGQAGAAEGSRAVATGGNAAWQALSDTHTRTGEPVEDATPRAKTCDDCRCRLCWTVSGFNARRCIACTESGCKVGTRRSQACAEWLDDAIRAGTIVRTEITTPPNLDALRRLHDVADLPASDEAAERLPERLHKWLTTFSDDVRAGRVDLLEVLDAGLGDALDEDLPLCPGCRERPYSAESGDRIGLCRACALRRLKRMTEQKVDELQAKRDYDAAKQQLKRLRDAEAVLPDRLKVGRDYSGRTRYVRPRDEYERDLIPTSTPVGTPVHECRSCGLQWHSNRPSGGLCSMCAEREVQRDAARVTAVMK